MISRFYTTLLVVRLQVMKSETLTTRVNRLEESYLKTQEQFRETDRHLKELGEKTDQRIAKLVAAIGELIGRIPPSALKGN